MHDDGMAGRLPATDARAPWLVRLTSPVHFIATLAMAMPVQRLLALPVPDGGAAAAMQLAGGLVAAAGLLLALACFALFARRRTTILPGGHPSGLVLRGPYRFTRNPMYVALVLSYCGLAAYLLTPWAIALLPLPLLALQRVVIPFEEARLHARFGGDYARYCARVPRWL